MTPSKIKIDGIKITDSADDTKFEPANLYETFYIKIEKGRLYEVETYSAGTVPLDFAFSDKKPYAGKGCTYIRTFDAGGSISYTPTEDGYLCYSVLKTANHDFKCTEFVDSKDEHYETYDGTAVRTSEYTFTKATFNYGHSDIEFKSPQGTQCYGIEYKSYDNSVENVLKPKTEIKRLTNKYFKREVYNGPFVSKVNYYIDKGMKIPVYYGLDVRVLKFNALNINFTYECEQNSLLKATLYNPTVWPTRTSGGIDTSWKSTDAIILE